jgi:pimeloyl-ACP methyl ester carboxylesterase
MVEPAMGERPAAGLGQVSHFELAGFPGSRALGLEPKQATAVVFIHGLWRTHRDFDPWLRVFSGCGFDSYAFSRQGRLGLPPARANGLTFEASVEDSETILDALGGTPVLVGHGMGGLLVQKLAEAGRARAAVLLAPASPEGAQASPPAAALPVLLTLLPKLVRGRPIGFSYRQARRILLNGVPEDARRRAYEGTVPDSGLATRQVQAGVPVDATRVTAPVLCVAGTEDRLVPLQGVRKVAAKYRADLREYLGRGHLLIAEPGWDTIASDVLSWLAERGVAAAREPVYAPV